MVSHWFICQINWSKKSPRPPPPPPSLVVWSVHITPSWITSQFPRGKSAGNFPGGNKDWKCHWLRLLYAVSWHRHTQVWWCDRAGYGDCSAAAVWSGQGRVRGFVTFRLYKTQRQNENLGLKYSKEFKTSWAWTSWLNGFSVYLASFTAAIYRIVKTCIILVYYENYFDSFIAKMV